MIVAQNYFDGFALMPGSFSLQMTLTIMGIVCVVLEPVSNLVQLDSFYGYETKVREEINIIILFHFILLVFLFFSEVYPIAKARVWFACAGQFIVIAQLLMIQEVRVHVAWAATHYPDNLHG